MIRESIKMSWQNITGSKMRSFLTILGVLIGVASVIALITIVQGITGEVTGQFSDLGANTVSVQIHGTPFKDGLTAQDVAGLEELSQVKGVSPTLSLSGTVASDGNTEDGAVIEGHNSIYFNQNPDLVERGRGLNLLDSQDRSKVCLIDDVLANKLFYGRDPVNQTIQINGSTFTVVGILSEDGDSSVLKANNESDDGKAIIPYETAMLLSGTGSIKSMDIFFKDTADTGDGAAAVERYLDDLFRNEEDSYKLINMEQLLSTMNSMTNMLTAALVGIASISLLVGGIGIMNMMLVSVKERTGEIGLRKALGADPGRIQLQFLLESIFLSLIGGILGVLLGIALSALVCPLLNVGFQISLGAIALGVCFSMLVGILFGWFPARNASLLNPIDALRSQ
jgi:ABC-type antimicrobial peptide transport system, permease component